MKYRRRPRFLFVPFVLAVFAMLTWFVMFLWNTELTGAIGVHAITYWQALGIFALSKILFGFGGSWGGPRHGGWKWRQMQEKLRDMTPEEKEKMKEQWRRRCGGWSEKDDTATSETPTSLAE